MFYYRTDGYVSASVVLYLEKLRSSSTGVILVVGTNIEIKKKEEVDEKIYFKYVQM